MGSVWRIAAKICHNETAFVLPFLSFSLASSQRKGVLDIILATGEDQGAMATMVVQATIQAMKAIMGVVALITMAIMEVADQMTMATMVAQVITLVGVAITMAADLITMVAQAITQADQTTTTTMEDQDTALEEGEVVLTTTGTTVGPATTLADLTTTMATTGMVAVGTTQGAAQVGMADQGETRDPRSTGKWSARLLELLQSW